MPQPPPQQPPPPPPDPGLAIDRVSFFRDITISKDETGRAAQIITDPVWIRAGLNVPAKDERVGYAGGATAQLRADISLNPAPAVPLNNTVFTATLPDCVANSLPLNIGAGVRNIAVVLNCNVPFPRKTRFHNRMNIPWSVTGTYNNRPFAANLGATTHIVYVTLGPPNHSPVFLTALHLGVSVDNSDTQTKAFLATWGLFSGVTVAGWDNRPLKYYGVFGFANGVTAPQLLSNRVDSGMCGAFASLLSQAAGVNGIFAPVRTIRQVNNAFFMVKNFTFPAPRTFTFRGRVLPLPPRLAAFPWLVRTGVGPGMNGFGGDVANAVGPGGQNMFTPSEKIFNNHVIVEANLPGLPARYFDSSYGSTYNNAQDVQDNAIDAVMALRHPSGRVWLARRPAQQLEFRISKEI